MVQHTESLLLCTDLFYDSDIYVIFFQWLKQTINKIHYAYIIYSLSVYLRRSIFLYTVVIYLCFLTCLYSNFIKCNNTLTKKFVTFNNNLPSFVYNTQCNSFITSVLVPVKIYFYIMKHNICIYSMKMK